SSVATTSPVSTSRTSTGDERLPVASSRPSRENADAEQWNNVRNPPPRWRVNWDSSSPVAVSQTYVAPGTPDATAVLPSVVMLTAATPSLSPPAHEPTTFPVAVTHR